jgi:hypothetical protein
MQYSALLVGAEVIAMVVENAVPVPESSMGEELHPRIVPDSLGAVTEGADRHEIDIADLCGQFLKHLLPCGDGLISGANEVVQKYYGIICTKSGSEQIASADRIPTLAIDSFKMSSGALSNSIRGLCGLGASAVVSSFLTPIARAAGSFT